MTAPGVPQTTFAHRAEYVALRSAVAAMERLSFTSAGRFGARLGGLGYRPLGIRRAVVERQLTVSLPDRTPAEIEQIARGAYAHLGQTSIETAILPSYSKQ
ncbi:MAG: hypothetical protein ABI205_04400, partial [Gemmatimonadaceae bacterium]